MATRPSSASDNRAKARERLAEVGRLVATKHRHKLDDVKAEGTASFERDDWLWESLLGSFSTMGRSKGVVLVRDPKLHNRVTYASLARLPRNGRKRRLKNTLRAARLVRMPDKKADWLFKAFERISDMGGPLAAKTRQLSAPGRERKLEFLRSFDGIGPKYSRNMLMDAYHPEFHDSIALDQRIMSVSRLLGLHSRTTTSTKISFAMRRIEPG